MAGAREHTVLPHFTGSLGFRNSLQSGLDAGSLTSAGAFGRPGGEPGTLCSTKSCLAPYLAASSWMTTFVGGAQCDG